jgi:hypothetical protein
MTSVVVAMLVILVVAAGTMALAMVGRVVHIAGGTPRLIRLLRLAARHLNGEGHPPRMLLQLFDRH